MKSWRRPWQATGDKSNVGHPAGASRFNRVIPSPATPSTGHRTPLPGHRFATPYGLRSAAASPQSQGPNRPKRNYMAALRLKGSLPHVMTTASIGASKGGGYARYLEGKTVEPERGDYYLTPDGELAAGSGPLACRRRRRSTRLGIECRRAGGRRGFRRVDGGPSPADRALAAARGRGWRPGRRDRLDVQRAEVRVGRCGRSRDAWQREQIETRARQRGGAGRSNTCARGAGGASPLRRPGRRGAREGRWSRPSTATRPRAA